MGNVSESGGSASFDFIFNGKFEGKGAVIAALTEINKKVETLYNTMNKASLGHNLRDYWKSEKSSVEAVSKAYEEFNRVRSETTAGDFIKSFNSFKAQDGDIQQLVDKYGEGFNSVTKRAESMASDVASVFNNVDLKNAFSAFEYFEKSGIDTADMLSKVSQADMSPLLNQIESLSTALADANQRAMDWESDSHAWQRMYERLADDTGLEKLNEELSTYRENAVRAKEEFSRFLSTTDLPEDDWDQWGRFSDIFDRIEKGAITSKQAISEFKMQYPEFLSDDMLSGNSLDTGKIDEFISRLESACNSVEQLGQKFSEVVSNGVFQNVTDELTKTSTITEEQSAKFAAMAESGAGIESISRVISELVSASAEASGASSGIDTIYQSITKLVEATTQLGGIDVNQLTSIKGIYNSIANMRGISISEKTMSNLADGLTKLSQIPNPGNLALITSLKLDGFSNKKISKASLNNLTEYLPKLAEIDTSKIQNLADIKFDNLANLKIPKGNLTGIEDLAKASQALSTLSTNTQLDAIKSAVESVTTSLDKLGEKLTETKGKGAGGGGESELKLLSEDADAYNAALKKVNDTLTTAYANQKKWTTAESGASSGDFQRYSDEINRLETLKSELGDKTKAEFSSTFKDISAGLSEAVNQMESAGERVKLPDTLKSDTKEYSDAITKANNQIATMQRNLDSWGKIDGFGDANQANLKTYSDSLNDIIALRDKLKAQEEPITETSFAKQLSDAKSSASEVIPALEHAARVAKDLQSAQSFTPFREGMSGYSKMVSNIDEQISSIETKIAETRTRSTQLFGEGGNKELDAEITKLEQFLTEYNSLQEKLADGTKQGGISKVGAGDEYARITKGAKEAATAIDDYIRAANGSRPLNEDAFGAKQLKDAKDTLAIMQNNLKKWGAAENGNSKDAYNIYKQQSEALEQLIQDAEKGSVAVDDFKQRLSDIKKVGKESADTIKANGEDMTSFSTKLSGMIQRFSFYFSMTRMVMMTIQKLKEMVKASMEIETAMARIQIVTGATDTQMTSFFESASNQAKELGKNITDVAKSIETFSRLGYSLTDATQLSKYANIMSNVGDTTVENATTGITSIIKGYGLNPSDAEHVSDVLINVGQKYAISAEELMEAFQRGGAALAASGTSFEESAALFAATNASLQNAATTGTLWKTVSARIRSAKTELEELGEDTTDLADGFSKYREELKALTGVDIMQDEDHYKSMLTIFNELAAVWDDLRSDEARSRVAEILGGTRNLSGIMSTIQNIKDAQNAYNDAMNSAGVSMEANNIYMETTEAHVGQLKASFQELSVDVFNSDFMKGFVDGARGAVEILDTLIEKIGTFGTVAVGVLGGMAIAKNIGAIKTAFTGLLGALTGPQIAIAMIAITAISGLAKWYSDYSKQFTYEGKLEKASESAQKFKESTDELKSIDAEIESVRAKIEEINSIGGISINKEGELANLQSTLQSLEIEKALLEEINNLNKQQALDDASNFLGTSSSYETGKVVTKTLGSGQSYGVRETKEGTPLDKALDYQERINKATEERTQLLDDIKKSKSGEKKLDEATIKNYQQRADALKNELNFLTGEQKKTLEDIRTNYASLFDENGKVYDGYQKYVDDVNNFYKQIKDAGAKTTKSQLTSFVDDISKSFKNSKISGLSAEQFSKIFGFKNAKDAFGGNKLFDLSDSFDGSDEVTSAVESIVQKAKELGIISDTSSSSVRSLAESLVEAGVIGQESAEGLSDFAEAAEESTDAMEALNKYNDAYTSAMSASTSATGLNTQQIKDLTDAYKHLDGFDPSRLFEKTANGIHLNEEYLKNLNAQIENEKMTELWEKLEAQTEERNKLLAEGGDTSKIEAEIESTRQLIAQYEGLTSAYNKWQSAKSATKERDMYQNVGSAYEQMKETLDQGWYGDEELNAYLDMMLSASQRTGDAYEDFQKLDRKIEGTSHSLMDYWQYDDDKNLVTDGMYDFLDDVNKVFGDTYAKVDENGKYTWDLTNGKLEEVAEHFGTTTEMIQMFERALIDAGATVILDSQEIDDLQGNLQKLQQAGQISSDIDLGFEASEMSIEDIQSKIKELENEKVRIEAEADTGEADTALNQLDATIAALKNQEIAVKIQTQVANGHSVKDLLDMDDTTLSSTLEIDTSQVESAREMLHQLEAGVEAPVTIRIDEGQFAQLMGLGGEETMTVKAELDSSEPDAYQPENKDATAKFEKDSTEPDNYQPDNKSAEVIYSANTNNLPNTLPPITRTVNYVATGAVGPGQASGTLSVARANGTAYNAPWNFKSAYANGRVALNKDEVALVNELGTESIIRNGQWMLIPGGMHQEALKKGDIILSAAQTKALIETGRADGHGRAFALGTLLSNAYDSGTGGRRRKNSSSSSGSSGSKSSSGKSSGSSKGSSSSSSNGAKQAEEAKEAAENLMDWIEVAISRIQRSVTNFTTKSSRIFSILTDRLTAADGAISKVNKEMEIQRKGAERYLKQANSVGLSADLAKKVQDGTIDINNYDEATKKLIDDYKQWYEKALECKDAVLELNDTLGELYSDKFNTVQTAYDNRIELLNHMITTYDNAMDDLEARGYLALAEYYKRQKSVQQEILKRQQTELNRLITQMSNAVNSGAVKVNSEAWYDMQDGINACKEAIQETNTAIIELGNSYRNVLWERFEYTQELISNITDETEFLIKLMSNSDLYDEMGQLTETGLSTMGMHGQNYNTYMYQADKYAEEIRKINKELAKDPYNTILINKREEYLKAQRESILNAEDEKQAIVDLVEDGINKELDSLKKLIDTYNESLDSAKNLYDYQKKIKEQTGDIAKLRKQLAAYQNDTSEENRARVQKLNADLNDALEKLEESEYEHQISEQKKLLDDMYNEYEEILNKRLDNIDLLISDMIEKVNDNSKLISQTISDEASDVGYTITEALTEVWSADGGMISIITMYGDKFVSIGTSLNTVLNGIEAYIAKSAGVSNALSKDVIKNNTQETKAVKKSTSSGSSNSKNTKTSKASNTGKSGVVTPNMPSNSQLLNMYQSASAGSKVIRKLANGNLVATDYKEQNGFLHVHVINTKEDFWGWVQKSMVKAHAKGARHISRDETAWIDENGNELVLRPTENAMLTKLKAGDAVLNAKATDNIFDFGNNPKDFLSNLGFESASNAFKYGHAVSRSVDVGGISINIPIEHVEDYNDFVNQMRSDPKFEKFIQSMTVDRLVGGSKLSKNKYKW